jgi:hypothetical protein
VTATLIVSVSDFTDAALDDCIDFGTELDSRLVPVSWLLSPRPRQHPHRPDAPLINWLRSRLAVGDALVQHGFDHAVPPLAKPRLGRRAEFAGLPSHEAALRLIAAARALEDLGLRTDVFAPPRWLASAGTVVALRRRDFRVCADSTGVRLLDQPDDRLLRGRVLTFGGPLTPAGTADADPIGPRLSIRELARQRAQAAEALRQRAQAVETLRQRSQAAEAWRQRSQAAGLVRAATRSARRGGLVRIAAGAAELSTPPVRQAILDAVDAALAEGAQPATYRAPVPAPARLSA